ncbi:hypothetical protein FSPOR_11239 [Fusarium sporotrichioides]|uniref:Uncharacterized protein n=1 Tax=Fusarium sporotrichioides TaxID=5514 RepID=A0A395RHI4_FUSSP|nr:hypothetical protein FSPOR_11239 [Fusarium sporotrichioides]
MVRKYARKTEDLLAEVKNWGAFVTIGKVFHWNTTILQKHLSTQMDAKRWIKNRRQQARAVYGNTVPPSTPQLTSRVRRHDNRIPDNSPYPPAHHMISHSAPSHLFGTPTPSRFASLPDTSKSLSLSSPLFAPPSTPNRTPSNVNEFVNQWATGNAACDQMMKELDISPLSITPSSMHRTFGTPSSGVYTTPWRSIEPIPFTLPSFPLQKIKAPPLEFTSSQQSLPWQEPLRLETSLPQ